MSIKSSEFKKIEKKHDDKMKIEEKYGKDVIVKIYKLLIQKPHKVYSLSELAEIFNTVVCN